MNEYLMKAAEQAPGLFVLAGIVFLFLRAQGQQIDSNAERIKEFIVFINTITGENISAREASRQVIFDNTVATTECRDAMRQMTEMLREFLRKHPSNL